MLSKPDKGQGPIGLVTHSPLLIVIKKNLRRLDYLGAFELGVTRVDVVLALGEQGREARVGRVDLRENVDLTIRNFLAY